MMIKPICRIRPKIDDNPPSPENMPPPNNMPSRPAPRKPAARPPSRPRPDPLKNPPPAAAGAPKPGLPGWVMVRLNGWAADGAVDVLGGAENVRAPREPELMPPPTLASADEIANINGSASDRTTAIALTMPRARCVKYMSCSLNPRQGEAPLTWAVLPKSEATKGNSGCGPRSRACGDKADFTANLVTPRGSIALGQNCCEGIGHLKTAPSSPSPPPPIGSA